MTSIMIPTWVDGVLTPVEKLDAHVRGLRHKAVSVFVLRGDEVLIQRRALGKYHTPGLWANTCCTHPMWDETSLDCAVRRLDEELGIKGLTLQYRDQVEYRTDVGGGLTEHEVVDIFLAEATIDLQIRHNPDEVMDTRWISFAELSREASDNAEQFTPWLRIYFERHASQIFGTLAKNCAD